MVVDGNVKPIDSLLILVLSHPLTRHNRGSWQLKVSAKVIRFIHHVAF